LGDSCQPVRTKTEGIVGIRYQATASENIAELECAIVRSRVRKLSYVFFHRHICLKLVNFNDRNVYSLFADKRIYQTEVLYSFPVIHVYFIYTEMLWNIQT
jgi:hypothetical protein